MSLTLFLPENYNVTQFWDDKVCRTTLSGDLSSSVILLELPVCLALQGDLGESGEGIL